MDSLSWETSLFGQLLWPDNQKPTLHLLMEPYGEHSFIVPMYKAKPIWYNNLFEDCTSSKVKYTYNFIGAFGSALKGQTLSLSLSLIFFLFFTCTWWRWPMLHMSGTNKCFEHVPDLTHTYSIQYFVRRFLFMLFTIGSHDLTTMDAKFQPSFLLIKFSQKENFKNSKMKWIWRDSIVKSEKNKVKIFICLHLVFSV